LHARLAAALVGLSCAAAALLGGGFWAMERWVESRGLPLELRERELLVSFLAGTLLIGLAAWRLSYRLAAQALEPLDALVAAIRALDPEAPGTRLKVDQDSELAVIAEAVNGYIARLEALLERERAFAAAASHELRTPLAVIAGAAEVIAQRPAEPQRALARIQRAVEQARFDLDALLALSRVREPPPAQAIALHEALPQWAEPHRPAQGGPDLVWRLTPATLIATPGSLHIVFTNLLRNALRAAGAAGTVEVELDGTGLRVIDDGPGIPPDELSKVFEPRFRGRDGGTGIGLYIARALAQRHGWQLTLENRGDNGAAAALRF
jgi:signal transduction histidine kinase